MRDPCAASDNPNLTDLSGLSKVRAVTGDFTVYSNSAPTQLDGMATLTVVGGVRIVNNTRLTDEGANDFVDALDAAGGTVTVFGN